MYEELPGWKTETTGVAGKERLPPAAREYVDFLAAQAGVPVTFVGGRPAGATR